MPPRRRRSKSCSTATAAAAAPLPDGSIEQSIHQMLKSPLLEETRLPSFELEDFPEWWPAAATSSDQGASPMATFESMDDPLLHFPQELPETHSTLQGICSPASSVLPCLTSPSPTQFVAPPALPPMAKAAGAGSKRSSRRTLAATHDLGVDSKSKSISPRESHILSERQRRKGMNHLFSTLASLLPETCSKSDKSTIVSEIISYIHLLRKDLEDLDKKRSDVLRSASPRAAMAIKDSGSPSPSICTTTNDRGSKNAGGGDDHPGMIQQQSQQASNVILSVCGSDAFITMICASKNRSVFSKVLLLLEHHKFRVLDANISTNASTTFHYFHVKALNSQLPKDALQRDLQSLTASETKNETSSS
ncbi:hypothetical protein SELMODRAFT_449119 [Selaginella moellendorffii]|uniref:BHLH domain-containing protein n=1 Tax=Selaginella moellendorffii TaxID=88036 RepID=D8TCP6_SELML|nr:transcription factor bHLH99 [Selaginella moellendorffii]EFJ05572.1 hypothetical protein SELMODRAFT_449119 [Selaginella moellendorffii]|eukprot:XP_002993387.1 transcription factor bHLH99 [Selaginella moellendorffii]